MFRTGFVGRQFPSGLGAGSVTGASPSLNLDFTSGVLDSRITFTRASTATYFDSTGTMQSAANNVPRFDYDPVSRQQRGLLIEEQRINICWPSAIGASWTASNGVMTANSTTAPDGTNTGTSFVDDTSNAQHQVVSNVNPAYSNATAYTFSVFAKQNTAWGLQIFVGSAISDLNTYANFNLSTGVVGTVSGLNSSASMQNVGNGWYRCALTITTSAAAATVAMALCLNNNNNSASRGVIYVGTGTGVYIWGAQTEAGTFPTSYIPTTASAVTRAADVCYLNNIGNQSWFNRNAGTIAADFTCFKGTFNGTVTFGLSDNTFGNSWYHTGSNIIGGITVGSGTAYADGRINKVAATYGTSSRITISTNASASNGGTTSATPPYLWNNRLTIGCSPWGLDNILNGYISRLTYWPRALDGGELQAATSTPTLDIDLRAPTLDPRITFTRTSSGSYFNNLGVLSSAGVNVPRLDYDPVTLQPNGLLVEEARTNLVTQSGNLSTFTLGNCSLSAGVIAGLDGTNSGNRVTENASGPTDHSLDFTFVPTANAVYTASVFAKAGTRRYLSIQFRVASNWVNFIIFVVDLVQGTILSPTNPPASTSCGIVPYSNGWYRIWITATASAAPSGNSIMRLGLGDTYGNTVYIGDGVSYGYYWGAQLEVGAFATSYIPTSGAAATRQPDLPSLRLGPWYNANAFSVVNEFSGVVNNASGFPRLIQIDDNSGNNNNSITHLIQGSGGRTYSAGTVAGANAWSLGPFSFFTPNTLIKQGGTYSNGAQTYAVNGGSYTTAAAASLPAGQTMLRIGTDVGNSASSEAIWHKRIRMWPRLLSQTELQAATT